MKTLSLRSYLLLMVGALLGILPFQPAFRDSGNSYHIDYEVVSEASGYAQVYWDNGTGYAEVASDRVFFGASNRGEKVSLRVPAGVYARMRFDPNDRPAGLTLRNLRITSPNGTTVRPLTLQDFGARNQIESVAETEGGLQFRFAPGANDPQVEVVFTPPIALSLSKVTYLVPWLLSGAALFGVFLIVRIAWDRSQVGARVLHQLQTKPLRTVAWIALGATLLSTYPVWLLGKSFVSPNNGGALLYYEVVPSTPGYKDRKIYDVKGSDVGAIMWSHIPFGPSQRDALLDGELPLWNRYNSCGTALLGQGQSMFGDPLLLPVLAVGSPAWAWDLRYLAARWMFCFGLGACTWLVARHAGAAALVTLASAFAGFFTYRINHPAVFSMSYGPWVLLTWLWLTHATTRRGVYASMAALAAANFALLNSGTVKEAYMLLLTMNFSGAVYCLSVQPTWQLRFKRLFAAALALVVFVLISAPVWLTFLHQLKGAYTSYNRAHTFQIQPSMLLGFFDELFYRPLTRGDWVFNPSVNFVILTGFLLFVVGIWKLRHEKGAIALAGALVFPAALAFGLVPPEWVVATPFLGNVAHVDNSFSCGMIVLVSVLSGVGFARASRHLASDEARRDLFHGALLIAAMVWMWIAFGQAIHRSVYGTDVTFSAVRTGAEVNIHAFVAGSLVVLILALAYGTWLARSALQARRMDGYHFVGLLVCFWICVWRLGVHSDLVGFNTYTTHFGERPAFNGRSKAVDAMRAHQMEEPSRVFGLKGNLFPGWTGYLRLESINGPDALINPYYRELTGFGSIERIWDWRLHAVPTDVARIRPFLDFLNVRYIADYQSDQGLLGGVLKPVVMADLDIYESDSFWPRAFFTDRIVVYDSPEEIAKRVEQGTGQWFASIQRADFERGDRYANLKSLGSAAGTHQSRARDYRLKVNSTEFTVDASGPGVAVLHEVFSNGDFRATIDGVKVPVLRVNHAFRGVWIPAAGTHRVEIWYQPRGYLDGLTLCAIGGGLILLIAFLHRRLPL